eukprot:5153133-Pyramimonas_sp.AAC.1
MAPAGFVDDLANKVLESNVAGTSLDKLETGGRQENMPVDLGMRVVGASQNISKQENAAYIRGTGAHIISRLIHEKRANIDGATMHHARYLGGLQTSTFSPAPELSK